MDAPHERLARVQRTQRFASADDLLAIGQRCDKGLTGPAVARGDLL